MTAQVNERPRFKVRSIPKVSPSLKLGKIELAALTLTIAAIGLVIGYYFTALAPTRTQLAAVEQQRESQKTLEATLGGNDKPSQKQMMKLAKDSLASFQSEWLKPYEQGRIEAINEINALVKSNKVHLTSGISMKSVANKTLIQVKGTSKKKDADFLLDVYPRVQMNFVVFGEYKDLRKFIRDLQASKQFLVMNSISITPVEQKQGRGRAQVTGPMSGLALSVGLNAFFHP